MMKHLIITLVSSCIALSALAQDADTTKLDFERPTILINSYFDGVKAHLSAEGRKAWKPEFSLRANVMLLDGSVNLTGGIRTSQNKVFGLGAGWGQRFFIYEPELRPVGQRLTIYLYHRHYIPLGHRQRVSFYSDIMGGGMYVYKMSGSDVPTAYPAQAGDPLWWFTCKPGGLSWYFSWQPGIAIRMWGKSNFFFGLSIGPSYGVHAGIAL
jgi:hypothetical protein